MTISIDNGRDVLLVIDMQIDHISGPYGDPEFDEILAPVNAAIALFDHVIVVKDWHPQKHFSFASAHPGAALNSFVKTPYGEQMIGRDHCIQRSPAAVLADPLELQKL